MKDFMNVVDINNPHVLEILHRANKLIDDGIYKSWKLRGEGEEADRWVGKQYFDYIRELVRLSRSRIKGPHVEPSVLVNPNPSIIRIRT